MKILLYFVAFVILAPVGAFVAELAYNPTRTGTTYPRGNTQTERERRRDLSRQLKREERKLRKTQNKE